MTDERLISGVEWSRRQGPEKKRYANRDTALMLPIVSSVRSFIMANVVAGNLNWFASGDATWLQPGQSHEWFWNLGNLGEAISISVRPFAAIFGR